MQYYQDPMMFNPYAEMMGGGFEYDPRAQQEFAQMLAEQERQRQEQEQQNQSMSQDFGDQLSDYMNQGQTPTMNPSATTMGATPGMSSSAAVNAAGGTLQSSAAAPLAQSAPLASQTMLSGGGSVVGPMSQAPVAGMSMAPAATAAAPAGGATVAGTTAAGTAAAPAAAGGAAAGGAAGSAGAGAAMAAAPWIAIPAAAIGSMQWTNNTNDDVSWGDWVTNPGNAHDALGGNIDDISTRLLGDNMLGDHVGDFLGAPADVLFPSSPGDWFKGVGDALLLNQSADVLKEAGSWIGDLFGGLF